MKSILDLVDRKVVTNEPPDPAESAQQDIVPPEDISKPLEPVVPVAPGTPTPPPVTPEPPVVDRLGILKEEFNQDWQNEDEFNVWKNSLTEYPVKFKEYEDRITALQKEKEDLEKSFDPKSLFASDELFMLNGLLKKFPDKNPATLTEISTRDFSKTYLDNPVEVLATELMLEHPGIYSNRSDAEEDVRARYNVEEQDDQGQWLIDAKARRRMQVDAKSAIDKFSGLRNQIEIPKAVDRSAEKAQVQAVEQQRIQKMTEATEKLFTKVIPQDLKAIDFEETIKGDDGKETSESAFRFEIGEGYVKSKAVQDILATVRASHIREASEWTPEKEQQVRESVVELLKANYLLKHSRELYAAMRDDLFAKYKDDAWMQRHRPRPNREDTNVKKTDDKTEKLARQQADFLRARGIKA
jgi:hypothetical protein